MVGSLNAELTPNIVPAKVLPENYAGYIGDGGGFPVVTFNQHEKAFLTYLAPLSPNPRLLLVKGREPSSLRQRQFRERIVVGDSGNPAFLLLDGQAVLLYTRRQLQLRTCASRRSARGPGCPGRAVSRLQA